MGNGSDYDTRQYGPPGGGGGRGGGAVGKRTLTEGLQRRGGEAVDGAEKALGLIIAMATDKGRPFSPNEKFRARIGAGAEPSEIMANLDAQLKAMAPHGTKVTGQPMGAAAGLLENFLTQAGWEGSSPTQRLQVGGSFEWSDSDDILHKFVAHFGMTARLRVNHVLRGGSSTANVSTTSGNAAAAGQSSSKTTTAKAGGTIGGEVAGIKLGASGEVSTAQTDGTSAQNTDTFGQTTAQQVPVVEYEGDVWLACDGILDVAKQMAFPTINGEHPIVSEHKVPFTLESIPLGRIKFQAKE